MALLLLLLADSRVECCCRRRAANMEPWTCLRRCTARNIRENAATTSVLVVGRSSVRCASSTSMLTTRPQRRRRCLDNSSTTSRVSATSCSLAVKRWGNDSHDLKRYDRSATRCLKTVSLTILITTTMTVDCRANIAPNFYPERTNWTKQRHQTEIRLGLLW